MRSGPISGNNTTLAESDVEPGQRQDDETGRRHPVHKTLEGVEAHDVDAGAAGFDPHHAAHEIENDEQTPSMPSMAMAPIHGSHTSWNWRHIRPMRLLDDIGFGVRDGAEALDAVELLQQLLLLDGVGVRIDRIGLLGRNGCRSDGEDEERNRGNDEPDARANHRHGLSPLISAVRGRTPRRR